MLLGGKVSIGVGCGESVAVGGAAVDASVGAAKVTVAVVMMMVGVRPPGDVVPPRVKIKPQMLQESTPTIATKPTTDHHGKYKPLSPGVRGVAAGGRSPPGGGATMGACGGGDVTGSGGGR